MYEGLPAESDTHGEKQQLKPVSKMEKVPVFRAVYRDAISSAIFGWRYQVGNRYSKALDNVYEHQLRHRRPEKDEIPPCSLILSER